MGNTIPAPRVAASASSMAAAIEKLTEIASATTEMLRQIETLTIVIDDEVSDLMRSSSIGANDAIALKFINRLVAVADGLAVRGHDMAQQIETGLLNLPEEC